MADVARLSDKTSCGDVIVQGSGNVFVNGLPIARLSDKTSGHESWHPNFIVEGSGNVFANGLPIARVGDKHAGHSSKSPSPYHQTAIATGSSNVKAN